MMIGNLSFGLKYAFVTRETKFKHIALPSIVLIFFGILYLMIGEILSANFLFLGALAIIGNWAVMPAIDGFQNKFLPWLEEKYRAFLSSSLFGRRPLWYFLGMFGLLFFSIGLLVAFTPKVLFFPVNQPNYVNVFVQHPIGTDIKVTNETTLEVERILEEEILVDEIKDTVGLPYEQWIVQSVIAQVGDGTSDPSAGVVMGNTPHKGRVTINFAEFKNRGDYETGKLMEKISKGHDVWLGTNQGRLMREKQDRTVLRLIVTTC